MPVDLEFQIMLKLFSGEPSYLWLNSHSYVLSGDSCCPTASSFYFMRVNNLRIYFSILNIIFSITPSIVPTALKIALILMLIPWSMHVEEVSMVEITELEFNHL